ncbi:thylakoid membrane photosystem I accumulation factor [Synechococcus sp. Cu2B8-bc1011]|uniref:thylakoid membrane photosystem I accumulation factor n=1 Tax=Synechococcus sp. Cu2B8-bc1011 TaxID=3093725 RepID=UPI0039AF5416
MLLPLFSTMPLLSIMRPVLRSLIAVGLSLLLLASPSEAARDTDSYDGNIFALYAGNGSLVPPPTTLKDALENERTSVIVFYLDDSSNSKIFSPVVSELQRLWGRELDLLPFTTDAFQGEDSQDPSEPATYWHGTIPQVVVIDGKGNVLLDEDGQVPLEAINAAISAATGIEAPAQGSTTISFNELNTEVLSR